jgi:PAS domain S-box-containing protein
VKGTVKAASFPRTSVVGFVLASVLLAGVAWIAVRGLGDFRQATAWVSHTLSVREEAEGLLLLLTDAQTEQSGYLLTGAPSSLSRYEQALASIPRHLARLRALTADNPAQQANVAALDDLLPRMVATLLQEVETRRHQGLNAAVDMARSGEGERIIDRVRDVVTSVGAEENRLLTERRALEEKEARWAMERTIGGLCAAIGLLVLATVLLARALRHREKQETRLQALLESAPDAMVVIDSQGSIVMVNAQTEKLFGYQRRELLGKPVEILVPERFRDRHTGHRRDFFAHPHTRPMGVGLELFGVRRDSSEFPVEIGLSPLATAEGTLVTAAIRDITDQKRAEDALQDLRELYEKLLGVQSDVGDGVTITSGTRLVFANDALCRMYGYTLEELMALPSQLDIVAPEERERLAERLRRRMAGESLTEFGETQAIRKDGTRIINEYAVKPVKVKGETLIISIVRDITERKRSEESIRQLSQRLLQVQDEEQQRISRELQSGVVRALDELRAQLSLVRDSGTVFDWRTSDALRASLDLVRKALKEARTLSHLLHPRLLEESGIVEAIRYYQNGFQERTGIRVILDAPGTFGRLSAEAERSLFRAVQESLANIHRHAEAATAWISLRAETDGIRLEVRDDGRGMHPGAATASGGVGIRSLMERMSQLGGWLEILSDGAAKGTRVIATLPLSVLRREESPATPPA